MAMAKSHCSLHVLVEEVLDATTKVTGVTPCQNGVTIKSLCDRRDTMLSLVVV